LFIRTNHRAVQLAPLANQVIFKRAFSEKMVFDTFVEDIAGVKFSSAKIEAEKKFVPAVGGVDVTFDLFAESEDGRAIVEIQRVRYDQHFHRFMHYFLLAIVEQVKSHKDYRPQRQVYTIVVLTAPYVAKDPSGRLVEDSMLISTLDPRTVGADPEFRPMFGHKLIFLNPHYDASHLEPKAQEWFRLLKASLSEATVESEADLPELLGTTRPALLHAAKQTLSENLSPADLQEYLMAKEEEKSRKAVLDRLDEVEAERDAALAAQHESERKLAEALAELAKFRGI
jgi:hypothetical protein